MISFKMKYTRQIVWLFVILPVAVLIVALLFLSIKQNLFESRTQYWTTLQDANGLATQTPILFKGFEIGKIRQFNLADDKNIRVDFYILNRYQDVIVQNSVILRTTNPITNRTILEFINNPSEKASVPSGSKIISTDFEEGRRLLRQISPRTSEVITNIMENVATLTGELTHDDNPDKGAIFRLLYNMANISEKADAGMAELENILTELNRFTQNLNSKTSSDAGTVFQILSNVASITDQANRQMKHIDRMLSSLSQTADYLQKPDSLIVKMIDPTGEILLRPLNQTLIKLVDNLGQTEQMLRFLNRNNPEILMLINNTNETLATAQKTLEALNNHPLLRSGIRPTSSKASSPAMRIGEMPDE
ncbi:MAG: MCE family protein [Candidatus Cloacimonetes bacterium]|nr:MCE family protein [Candidatus Cloacimonadota bacterium]